jgi:hypothetical protein
MIHAVLRYSLPGYEKGKYHVSPQFQSVKPGVTFGIDFLGIGDLKTCGPRGVIEVTVPLRYMWSEPNLSKKPVKLVFHMLEGSGDVTEIVASTQWLQYQAN